MTTTVRAVQVTRALLMPKPAPVPWARVLRAAITVPAPFALGIAVGKPADGLMMSIGTIPALMADRGGPYRLRALRMGLTVMASAIGFLIGGAVRGDGWVAVVVVAGVAMVSGVASSVGARSSIAALNLLIYTAISSLRAFPGPLWWPALLVAAGGAWAMALSLSFWLVYRGQTERDAVAAAYDALADVVAAGGTPRVDDARRDLSVRLNEADDAVVSGRVTSGGTDRQWHRLLVMLNAIGPLLDATLQLARQGKAVDPSLGYATRHLAATVRNGRTPMDPFYVSTPEGAETWVVVWRRAARRIEEANVGPSAPVAGAPAGLPRPWTERARAVLEGPLSASETWLSAIRLTMCIGLALLLRELVIQDRSYWILLSVAVIMKPDFGSVFARATQRSLGTAIGVVIGGIVMTTVPGQWGLVLFIGLFAALLPLSVVRNYGMFAIFLTPLVLIQIDALSPAPGHLIADRLADTLLGAGIVLVFGYLLWPETWRPPLGRRFAEAVAAVDSYLVGAFPAAASVFASAAPFGGSGPVGGLSGPGEAARPSGLARAPVAGRAAGHGLPRRAATSGSAPSVVTPGPAAARRRAYRRLSDLRTLLQQCFADPAAAGRDAEALWPATVALERLCDGVSRVAASVAHGASPPPLFDVERVSAGLHELGAAAAGRYPPASLDLPRDGPLAPLSDELDNARSAIRRITRRRLSRPSR